MQSQTFFSTAVATHSGTSMDPLATLRLWAFRAKSRRQLARRVEDGDQVLFDTGLSYADAMAEVKKPFWVA